MDRLLSKRENYPVSNNLEDNEQKTRVTINHETELVIRKKEMEPRKVAVHLEEPLNIFSSPSKEPSVWTKLFYQRKESKWISAYSAFSHFIFWNIHQGKTKLFKSWLTLQDYHATKTQIWREAIQQDNQRERKEAVMWEQSPVWSFTCYFLLDFPNLWWT